MTNMALLFGRMIVPAWLFVFGVVAMFLLPMTMSTAVFLLVVGLVPPVILFLLSSNSPSPTIAEVLRQAEVSRTER